jgi:hypothetical protein
MARVSCKDEDLLKRRRDFLPVVDTVGGNAQSKRPHSRNRRVASRAVGHHSGMDSTSAHRRPSSSCPRTMGIDFVETVPLGLARYSITAATTISSNLRTPSSTPTGPSWNWLCGGAFHPSRD